MHRYPAAGGSSGVPGGGGGPPLARDSSRSSDPSSFQNSTNFSFASRRAIPLQPYKLRCDREPLSARLGPPDFYPPTPNCAEEILNRDTCQIGYKEIIEFVEEPKEALLSLAANNALWSKSNVNRYKESIRKRLRELNNALIRKRKAGQVYGVPLSGPLLAKSGIFPEQRNCGEDSKKKWIEDLSQRKRLRSLAETVPHGYQRRTIFEALIKHDVPLLRATWFIKISYLNQVKPMSIGMSAGGPDKSQSKRVELWTRNVLEYAQWLLDDLCQPGRASRAHTLLVSGGGESTDGEPDALMKWRYIVRLAQWHYSEGLLHRTQVVDWALKQLQEKESVEALELLLPIVLEMIDGISLSQTHARILVDTCLQWLRKLYPSGHIASGADHSNHRPVAISLVEVLQYLLVVIPDTFVGMDCFPLPQCVSLGGNNSAPLEGTYEELDRSVRLKDVEEAGANITDRAKTRPNRELVMDETVDYIEKRIASLVRAVSPTLLRNNEGKVVQALDKALIQGDIAGAYRCVYDQEFCSSDNLPADWKADVTSSTAFNLSGPVNPSELYAVRFLCEWAVSDFRDSRGSAGKADQQQSAYRDMSRVYMAVSVLRLRISELEDAKVDFESSTPSLPEHLDGYFPTSHAGVAVPVCNKKGKKGLNLHLPMEQSTIYSIGKSSTQYNLSEGSSSVHDLIYAWLDQHELWHGDSSERLPLLLSELVREGLLSPEVYVRQLLCNGVLNKQSTASEIARAARHRHVLQHLPSSPSLFVDDDRKIHNKQSEASQQYRIERRLALHGLGVRPNKPQFQETGATGTMAYKEEFIAREVRPSSGLQDLRDVKLQRNTKSQKRRLKVAELKHLIAACLQFPEGALRVTVNHSETKARPGVSGKRLAPATYNSMEIRDATPGCEECSRTKRLKISEGKGWIAQGSIIPFVEEEESWWVKKGPKVMDAVKVEPPVKPAPKQTTRGRPKTVRKTTSLAQLATNRIESSHGASSSHVLETKVSCPFHQLSSEGGTLSQVRDNNKPLITGDLHAIGAVMKRFRVGENRVIVNWVDGLVRNLVSSCGPTFSNSQGINGLSNGGASDPDSAELGGTCQWRMSEEQLAIVVYIMDVGNDLHTLVQLLLWLLPVAATSPSTPPGHVNRGVTAFAGNKDCSLCDVGEAAILSCLQRYEGVLAAMDLLPQALSAGMRRAANVMALPGGRAGCSALLCYVRDLLRKFGSLASVQAWEKTWKTSCDQRLRAELEALKAGDSEGGFGLVGSMGDDRDEPIAPRLTGRLARVGTSMKEIVTRGMNEAMQIILNKERDTAGLVVSRDGGGEGLEDGYQAAQRVVLGIMDAIRQNSNGAPQADAALVANAVQTIVNVTGQSVVNVLESLGYNNSGETPTSTSPAIRCGHRMLQIHVYCLQLLKDSIDDRQIRMLEVALAAESGSIVMSGMGHSLGRAPRSQFHLSPETPEPNSTLASDGGVGFGRATMAAAVVSALVTGLVVSGVTSLERMVSVLRVKDGLENLQLQKPGGLTSNGRVSAMGVNTKADNVAEAHIHWFRVLIGDCRTVVGGLVADLLGEATVLGLARMQRSMPLAAVFPPAYAIFAAALRRQQPIYINNMIREDAIIQAVTVAVNDMVAHEPFRDVCLRDTGTLYRLLSSDSGESDYAAMLDMQNNIDSYKKVAALVPLRARLFLHALLDRKMPEEDIRGQNRSSTGPGQVEQVVQVLDELQAATFHWQWVELRLLLNEQVVLEKLKTHPQSAQEAVQAAMQGPNRQQLAECEKTFTEVVLTRLLVRPDAAALYSQTVHLLGKALEDYLILHVKWVLENNDMLIGRKSLRQLLDSIAVREGFSVGGRQVKSWDWQPPRHVQKDLLESDDKKQSSLQGTSAASPEEGELEDDGMDWQKSEANSGRQSSSGGHSQPFATEKALADLVLPCLARSSMDTRNGFAFELVKQMNNLEQHISNLTRNIGRMTPPTLSGGDGILGPKGSGTRRGARSGMDVGSPGLGRRFPVPVPESVPVSSAALQTSMWLRLQFLLPLLPIIQTEREQVRNMRQTLAPVLLRLLSTRVVQEAADIVCYWESSSSCNEFERNSQAASAAAAASAGEPLFDRLLSILHALLSSTWAVWLKPRKGSVKPLRDIPPFDREAAERMQGELEHMTLPAGIRARLQAAMPLLLPTPAATISAGPPQIPATAVNLLQASLSSTASPLSITPQGVSSKLHPLESNIGKAKAVAMVDPEIEVDPWTLLEDGVGASSGPVGEVGNFKACAWLKGAVRVRRSDLTYVGAVDEDP